MLFKDRQHAGKELAKGLRNYEGLAHAIVIGLPRGGVPVAYEVAKELHLPMDIVSLRKIGAPQQKELAIGAITESGEGYFNTPLIARLHVSKDYIAREVEKEKNVAKDRNIIYRKNRPPLNLSGKTALIVDDGLATGATMKAALQFIKSQGANKTIVAVPVSAPDTLTEIKRLADEVITLYAPTYFSAVGEFYDHFEPTLDSEVICLMEQNMKECIKNE